MGSQASSRQRPSAVPHAGVPAINQTQHCKQLAGLVVLAGAAVPPATGAMQTIIQAARESRKTCQKTFADSSGTLLHRHPRRRAQSTAGPRPRDARDVLEPHHQRAVSAVVAQARAAGYAGPESRPGDRPHGAQPECTARCTPRGVVWAGWFGATGRETNGETPFVLVRLKKG
ncbi:hypothetical protein CRUP_031760 [Coryphaenoides rupestris]|nr:hypothetical protein CRUP_031760 [Coryphaenoides rupestris]